MNNKELSQNYTTRDDEEVIPWTEGGQYVGFSVLRKYRKGLGFIPATTKDGAEDTVVLIKVGGARQEKEGSKIALRMSVSKYSKYKNSHLGFNFDDPEAPTKESYEQSELSTQPIDLEENDRFTMQLQPLLFFDEKTKKKTSLDDMVSYLYEIHMETIQGGRARIFKAKLGIRNFLCSRMFPWITEFTKTLLGVFGKELKNDPEDFAIGLFKTYSFPKHIGTKYLQSLPFFKTDIRISIFNILWIALTSFLLWFFYFSDKIINETFSLSLLVLIFIAYEFIIPFLLVGLINLSIVSRIYLEALPIKFR